MDKRLVQVHNQCQLSTAQQSLPILVPQLLSFLSIQRTSIKISTDLEGSLTRLRTTHLLTDPELRDPVDHADTGRDLMLRGALRGEVPTTHNRRSSEHRAGITEL